MRDLLRLAALPAAALAIGAAASTALHGYDPLGAWVTAPLPHVVTAAAEVAVGAGLAAFGLGRLPRSLTPPVVALLAFGALVGAVNAARFYVALAAGTFTTPAVVPASMLASLVLGAFAWAVARAGADAAPTWSSRRGVALAVASGCVFAALPLSAIACFGVSRYARKADVAVVLGARVYASGRPSEALADRVDEAIRLYKSGAVASILMSGGIDPKNGQSEPEAMRLRAEAAGVPAAAILLDEAGNDTRATAVNTARILKERRLATALVVTHYFHEPRTKLLMDRAGVRAFTVPAHMRRRLLAEPWYVAREIAAYYVALARS